MRDKCGELEGKSIKDFLVNNVKHQTSCYKYIAALRKYEEWVLKSPKGILFGEHETELLKIFKLRTDSGEKSVNLTEDTINRKINGLRNEKLKYALRLQLKSGLRVSEVSKLQREDFEFREGIIKIFVKEGKGRKNRKVVVLEDIYLYERLPKFIESSGEGKLFYSRDYLRHKAAEHGIKTHDLRRVNAKTRLKTEMQKGKTRMKAKEKVKEELGHETVKITNMYLRYKIK